MELENGQLYYYCGNGIPAPEIADFESKFVDEIPEEEPRPVTIYVNLGANQAHGGESLGAPILPPLQA